MTRNQKCRWFRVSAIIARSDRESNGFDRIFAVVRGVLSCRYQDLHRLEGPRPFTPFYNIHPTPLALSWWYLLGPKLLFLWGFLCAYTYLYVIHAHPYAYRITEAKMTIDLDPSTRGRIPEVGDAIIPNLVTKMGNFNRPMEHLKTMRYTRFSYDSAPIPGPWRSPPSGQGGNPGNRDTEGWWGAVRRKGVKDIGDSRYPFNVSGSVTRSYPVMT